MTPQPSNGLARRARSSNQENVSARGVTTICCPETCPAAPTLFHEQELHRPAEPLLEVLAKQLAPF